MAKTTISELIPCNTPSPMSLPPNIGLDGSRGGRVITSLSSGSASKTMEQAGSITNSRNRICTGMSAIGLPSKTGTNDIPAMGTCTATI